MVIRVNKWKAFLWRLSKLGEYLRNHLRQILIVVLAIIGVVILVLIGVALYLHFSKGLTWAQWTGFSQYYDADGKLQRGKTLWDWLELLIVPIVLAVGAFWLQSSERVSERKLAEQRREDDQRRAKDQQQETALQAYIDRMTELLLDEKHPLRESVPDSEVRAVGRALTLATLRGLDPIRKGMLLKFLYESKLITPVAVPKNVDSEEVRLAIIILRGADLSQANLNGTNLSGADLSGADLSGANLVGSNLTDAILTNANLSSLFPDMRTEWPAKDQLLWFFHRQALYDVNYNYDKKGRNYKYIRTELWQAILKGSQLRGADLCGTNFSFASLENADMSEANLTAAQFFHTNIYRANLSNADLSYADVINTNLKEAIVTNEQLATVNRLENTVMANGQIFNPVIHTFWKGPPAEPSKEVREGQ